MGLPSNVSFDRIGFYRGHCATVSTELILVLKSLTLPQFGQKVYLSLIILILILIRVKRLTRYLTTFDYGEDQTHWQSL